MLLPVLKLLPYRVQHVPYDAKYPPLSVLDINIRDHNPQLPERPSLNRTIFTSDPHIIRDPPFQILQIPQHTLLSFTMPKRARSPSSSPVAVKKQKMDDSLSPPITPVAYAAVPEASNAITPVPLEVIAPSTADVGNATEDLKVSTPVSAPVKAIKGKAATKKAAPKLRTKDKKKGPQKAATVQNGFIAWTPTDAQLAKSTDNTWWGIKPTSGSRRPPGVQPSARTSKGATNPPMFEDRGFRFKRGTRHVKYFGPLKPEGADNGPDLDQEDLLVIKLVDMRMDKKTGLPRRRAEVYYTKHGKPADWNNMQAIKALNDRRTQAIDRVTEDAPWTKLERKYLAQLLTDNPDASIWELAELHNDHFMDKDCTTGLGLELSEGRTVESVRYEYVTYKPLYDAGEVPETRWSRNKSKQGARLSERMEEMFGKPDQKLANEHDTDSDADADENAEESEEKTTKPKKKVTPKKATPKKEPKSKKDSTESRKKAAPKAKKPTKKCATVVDETEDEGELIIQAAIAMAAQPKFNDADEELLQLAGVYNPEEIRTSPRRLSFSSDSSLSDVPSDLQSPSDSPLAVPSKTKAPTGSPSTNLANIPDSPLSDAPSDLESPGTQEYNAALATIEKEAVATVIASENSKSPQPTLVMTKETVIKETTTVEEQTEDEVVVAETQIIIAQEEIEDSVGDAIEEQVTPVKSPRPGVLPTPRAIRDIEIDENYDDEDEDADDDEDEGANEDDYDL